MIERPVIIPSLARDPVDGVLALNPFRSMVRSWAQGTDRASRVTVAGSSTADDSIQVQPEPEMVGDFEITHFTSDHLGPYRIEVYAGGGLNQKLMDVPIHVDNFCGSAERPFYLPCSIFLEAGAILNVRFTNIATIQNKIRLKAHGRRFLSYSAFMRQRELSDQFYGRGTLPYFAGLNDTSLTLTASQTQVSSLINMMSHADLEAEYLVGKTQGPARLQIRESKGGRPIFIGGGTGTNAEIGVETSHILGTARDPYRFSPDGAYFKRRSVVQTLWDDVSAASNLVEIALVGRLLFFPESKRQPAGVLRVVSAA